MIQQQPEHQPRRRAHAALGGLPAPEKPVKEMSEPELEAYRKKVLEGIEAQVSVGKKNTFEFKVEIPEYPEYTGTITFHRPSMDEDRQIGIRTAKYLQGAVGVDLRTENVALFFATFDVVVDWDSAPEWFDPQNMPGDEYPVLEHVYGGFSQWLNSFRPKRPGEPHRGRKLTTSEAAVVAPGLLPGSAHGPKAVGHDAGAGDAGAGSGFIETPGAASAAA